MFPDFLCIGAQRAGTTWLYQNIKQHPEVWMPPVKEIHYFDNPSPLPLIKQVYNPERRRRVNKRLILELLRIGKPKKVRHIRWYLRYFLQPSNDEWYASLFPANKRQIAGDVTPGYARLEESAVAKIHALMPEAKIIYILRNPIHRTWSQAALYFNWNHQDQAIAKDKQIKEYIKRKGVCRNSDYLRALQIWEKFYPQGQFHVSFFGQLVQNPHAFLQDIYRFLELDASDHFIPRTVHEKRGAGQYPAMPDRFARYLASQYYEQTEQLHQRFDNSYTANWLEFAKQHL